MATDPVCGMTVEESTRYKVERDNSLFYFCSQLCLDKFLTPPSATADLRFSSTPRPSAEASGVSRYTCPMHPEIVEDHPGDCPKCGMALETARPIVAARRLYVCPMHPEVEQDARGACPKCGMDLEPKMISAASEDEVVLETKNVSFEVEGMT